MKRTPSQQSFYRLIFFALANICCSVVYGQFLQAKGKAIVNDRGETVLLRGIGLGGWMLQEGYMLRFQGEGQQYRIRERFQSVVGKEKVNRFYDAWLRNHVQKQDVDSLKKWGFNSVRLPMHFNLYTLPVEQEPVKGEQTWLEKGFALTDSLPAWCKANQLYLILDLHAAPGGQGNDFNISDRDPSKPSLWDSKDNQEKMVALWRKLALRYKDEPWIGGYDIINEPNWGFSDSTDKNGLKEQKNEPLRNLLVATTKAIREVDKKHLIIIEGNGWGNNYNGIFPLWDDNLVLSFHKYWNRNDQASIQHFLNLREQYNIPLWLGETGENSNVWFTEAVRLAEANGIGWAWWPLKKLGFNNPLQIREPKGYQGLLDYFSGKGPKPGEEEAFQVLLQLAENSRIENCIVHHDVVDALFRQVYTADTKPFKSHTVRNNTIIQAVDYDLGRVGQAYYDNDTANYHISTGTARVAWNKGRTYRNDGVDIALRDDVSGEAFFVSHMEPGEWLQYTVNVPKAGRYSVVLAVATEAAGELLLSVNSSHQRTLTTTGTQKRWTDLKARNVPFKTGKNVIRVKSGRGEFSFAAIRFVKDEVE